MIEDVSTEDNTRRHLIAAITEEIADALKYSPTSDIQNTHLRLVIDRTVGTRSYIRKMLLTQDR